MRAALLVLAPLVALPGCHPSCATYVVTVTLEDQASGELVCDATVTLVVGDAGTTLPPSSSPFDAEVPATSPACQWDVIVSGGTYSVAVSAPGFAPATASLQLSSDSCGTSSTSMTVVLTRG